MSALGQTLFGGSRFIRWSLTPFVLLFAVLMPLLVEQWTLRLVAMMGGLDLVCLALLAGFWLPARFGHWAFRVVAALVFLAYAAYVIHEFYFTNARFTLPHHRGEASPFNAVLGFIFIGLPSLLFAVLGRFSFRREASPEQPAEGRRAYEERILRPDWAFYERHLQRPAPAALRELYADRALVTATELDYSDDCCISTFEALEEQGLLDGQGLLDPAEQAGFDVVAIATTDLGDPIYLRPGATERDTVYLTHHDGGDPEVLADSVAAMLQRLRQADRSS